MEQSYICFWYIKQQKSQHTTLLTYSPGHGVIKKETIHYSYTPSTEHPVQYRGLQNFAELYSKPGVWSMET